MENRINNKEYLLDGTLESILERISDENLEAEEIAEKILDLYKLIRIKLQCYALLKGNKFLAMKIGLANDIISRKMIDSFKKAVLDGTYEDFLSNMSWVEKVNLKIEMGLFRPGLLTETVLNSEELRYYEIIQSAIDKDSFEIDDKIDYCKRRFK